MDNHLAIQKFAIVVNDNGYTNFLLDFSRNSLKYIWQAGFLLYLNFWTTYSNIFLFLFKYASSLAFFLMPTSTLKYLDTI